MAGAGQAQRIQRVIAIQEQRRIRVALLAHGAGPHEERGKGCPVDGAKPRRLKVVGAQMKRLAPTAQQRARHHALAPERVERGPVHVADGAVRQGDGGGKAVIGVQIQRMEGPQRARFRAGVIVHQHDPVGGKPFHRGLHSHGKAARATGIHVRSHHDQARIGLRGQPGPGRLVRGVVDNQNGRKLIQGGRQKRTQGNLKLRQPPMRDDHGNKPR
tara:strand:- start:3868 stop:4512 length:645 start_codon:yes stop_codon:yes gene_type:complete